jgi:mono/diheme cytochrome c family protein
MPSTTESTEKTTTFSHFNWQQVFDKETIMMTFQLSKKQYLLWGGIFLVTLIILLYTGCSSTKETGAQGVQSMSSSYDPPPGDPSAANTGAARGKKLFETVGCMGCHTVNGKGGKVGPNLSDEADKGKSREWLTTQIENPRANDPQTIMPAYSNLSKDQVSDLVDYLMTLSGKSTSDSGVQDGTGSASQNPNVSLTEAGQTWSNICGRCHNLRPPSEYSDAQWTAAVDQMRLLVPLTGQERREVLEFLKASN